MNWLSSLLINWVSNLSLIRISDILDILIMAFLIYKLMMLIRRTSSGQVVKGVLVVLVAFGLASFFQLTVFSYLLSRTLELGVLALVILFQPEIRRFLEQMGSGKLGLNNVFSHPDTPTEMENAILQTVEAYAPLSQSKTGALMVFERSNRLDSALKTGTALDAEVNSELLKNIFWNKAPLHDGAVIVRNGRLAGAGCMLPLSCNVNLSKDLGMRHRAGIGVSEQSDAVVAIVSEETGSISVAVGGMLKRHLAPETLERLLRNELISEEESGNGRKFNLINLFKAKKGDADDVEKDQRK